MEPTFTKDWFSWNIPIWIKLFSKYTNQTTHYLEIGSYEGRSLIWMVENILKHPESKAVSIDTFDHGTYRRFAKNTKNMTDRLTVMRERSQSALNRLYTNHERFDIIYIDGNRSSRHVLEDAVLSFTLLKPGGYLIFDDYTSGVHHDNTCPKQAIDGFVGAYAEEVKVVQQKWQLVVQKRIRPLKRARCRSEFETTPFI